MSSEKIGLETPRWERSTEKKPSVEKRPRLGEIENKDEVESTKRSKSLGVSSGGNTAGRKTKHSHNSLK